MSVLRTIPVEHVLERGRDANLRRMLRGRDLVGFGVGIIIGTGIFTLAGVEAKEHAGPAVTLSCAAVACFYLMLNLDLVSWLRFAVWLAIGLVIYLAYGRRHSLLHHD
jgi:hypothetical protein